jgi:hypothetical protein
MAVLQAFDSTKGIRDHLTLNGLRDDDSEKVWPS